MSDWQPMETAPRDGSVILAWGRYLAHPVTVEWMTVGWVPVCDGCAVIESQGDTWTDIRKVEPLSHWQPLPALPAVSAPSMGGGE